MNDIIKLKSKSIIFSSFLNFIRTLCNLLFPIITFSYSSRIVGVDGIGKVNFARSFIMYFTMIAMLGVNYYGTREAAKIRADRKKLNLFVREMIIINIFSTVLAYIILMLSLLFIPKLNDYAVLIFINSFAIFFNGLGLEWFYQAVEEYRYITIRAVLFQIIALFLMFLFVRERKDVGVYASICVFASSGSYIMNFFNCRKYIDFYHKKEHLQIKKHIKPILLLFAMGVSIDLYTVLDSTMLGFMKGDTAVGLYSAGLKINKIVNSLITSIGIVLLPRLSYYIEIKEYRKVRELCKTVYQFVFMLSIPAAIGLFMLSNDIILLFNGVEFQNAVFTMRLLVPIVLIIPFSIISNLQIFIPMKKEGLILMSTCAGAVTNFTCNYILIPNFSLNGAAVATVISESVVSIICLINIKKYFDLKEIFEKYYQFWIAAIPVIFVSYFMKKFFVNEFERICGVVLVSILLYFGLLLFMKNKCLLTFINRVKVKVLC